MLYDMVVTPVYRRSIYMKFILRINGNYAVVGVWSFFFTAAIDRIYNLYIYIYINLYNIVYLYNDQK